MIRVLLATGRPALDAAITAEPDLDVVAQAYYTDAAVTALAELQPDVAVIDPTLPGAAPENWLGSAKPSATQVVWLGHRNPGEPGHRRATSEAAAAGLDPRSVVSAIHSLGSRGVAVFPEPPCVAGARVHAFVGCLPRLGVTTAAAAFATSIASGHNFVSIVDANLSHPCVPEVLGLVPPRAGWDTADTSGDLASSRLQAHGVRCLALSCEAVLAEDALAPYERLKRVVGWSMRDHERCVVVVDLGAPRPLQGGRLAPWIDWAADVGASTNLVLAQDPQALLAAARVLRAAQGRGVPVRLWCANYDEQISSIADLSAALGRPCALLPWDRHAVVRRALAGKPPMLRMSLDVPSGFRAALGGESLVRSQDGGCEEQLRS